MLRKERTKFPGAIYHIISRGNYRKDLFTHGRSGKAFEAVLFEAAVNSRRQRGSNREFWHCMNANYPQTGGRAAQGTHQVAGSGPPQVHQQADAKIHGLTPLCFLERIRAIGKDTALAAETIRQARRIRDQQLHVLESDAADLRASSNA